MKKASSEACVQFIHAATVPAKLPDPVTFTKGDMLLHHNASFIMDNPSECGSMEEDAFKQALKQAVALLKEGISPRPNIDSRVESIRAEEF